MEPIRLLTFSTLFPNNIRPNHGVFVENRLRHLLGSGQANSTVIAPVPWFPSNAPVFGEWGRHAQVTATEIRNGILGAPPALSHHPQNWHVLRPLPALSGRASVRSASGRRGDRIDAIDAHYLYPDGVAAVWLGQSLGVPTVVTARGTDVNLIPRYLLPAP